jgi:nucleosome assembly protein 1-like 1
MCYSPTQIPENPDELGDEEMGALQEELSADFDIGYAIKDQVIPRAVEW